MAPCPMRHFDFLAPAERDRLFAHPPQSFDVDAEPEHLGVRLGATLYSPATRPQLARDIIRRAGEGVLSLVVCLEDSVADHDVAAAEQNVITELRELGSTRAPLPLIFVRVRHAAQIGRLVEALGPHVSVLAGFVIPKFTEESSAYFDAIIAAAETCGQRLLAMPVLEAAEIGYAESRMSSLLGARRLIDKYREIIPAVRLGATDLSGHWGLRRGRELTVWDLRVVADTICAVVNVFGRSERGYVIAGAVWEYFAAPERLFKPQLRESPFVAHEEPALRTKLIAADLDGLIREVVLDRANGLIGKTVIHPTHVAAVHALSVVAYEEFADAGEVLATEGRGGAVASSYRNKMNESKPHTAWARRVMQRAEAFGVAREGVSFVDLLGAGLHQ